MIVERSDGLSSQVKVWHTVHYYSNIYQKKVLSVVRLISRVGDSRWAASKRHGNKNKQRSSLMVKGMSPGPNCPPPPPLAGAFVLSEKYIQPCELFQGSPI